MIDHSNLSCVQRKQIWQICWDLNLMYYHNILRLAANHLKDTISIFYMGITFYYLRKSLTYVLGNHLMLIVYFCIFQFVFKANIFWKNYFLFLLALFLFCLGSNLKIQICWLSAILLKRLLDLLSMNINVAISLKLLVGTGKSSFFIRSRLKNCL